MIILKNKFHNNLYIKIARTKKIYIRITSFIQYVKFIMIRKSKPY